MSIKQTYILDSTDQIGLQRCGKSCRLRWTNYLRPDLKHGQFSDAEEQTIVKLHSVFGNRYDKFDHTLGYVICCVGDTYHIFNSKCFLKCDVQMVLDSSPTAWTHR